jgi:hypothetical protein
MTTFVSSNDKNFYGRFCKELDAAQAKEPSATPYVLFLSGGATIGKVDDKAWTFRDIPVISSGFTALIKKVETRLAQDENLSSVAELENMLLALNKMEKLSKNLFEKSHAIFLSRSTNRNNQCVLLFMAFDITKIKKLADDQSAAFF